MNREDVSGAGKILHRQISAQPIPGSGYRWATGTIALARNAVGVRVPLRRIERGAPIEDWSTTSRSTSRTTPYLAPFSHSRIARTGTSPSHAEIDTLVDAASEKIAFDGQGAGCSSIAFSYNDPVRVHELRDRTRRRRVMSLGLKAVR